jgi:hypothetical protein
MPLLLASGRSKCADEDFVNHGESETTTAPFVMKAGGDRSPLRESAVNQRSYPFFQTILSPHARARRSQTHDDDGKMDSCNADERCRGLVQQRGQQRRRNGIYIYEEEKEEEDGGSTSSSDDEEQQATWTCNTNFQVCVRGVPFILDAPLVDSIQSDFLTTLFAEESPFAEPPHGGVVFKVVDVDPESFSAILHLSRFGRLSEASDSDALISTAVFLGVEARLHDVMRAQKREQSEHLRVQSIARSHLRRETGSYTRLHSHGRMAEATTQLPPAGGRLFN